jgi:hypothetical protein
MNIVEIASQLVWVLPVYVAINELIKRLFPRLDTRFIPLINLVLGFTAWPMIESESLYVKCFACIILGLSAGGLFDLGKRTILNK